MKKHALVLGKMLDLHKGHEALIRYAMTKADKVTVLLCTTPKDRISPDVREDWLYRTFGRELSIVQFAYIEAGLSGGEVSDRGISEQWAIWVDDNLPTVDLIVGSEDYVRYMADYGSFDYDMYDKDRLITPCSSTAVNAGAYEFRVHAAKQSLSKVVYLVGPESTGKTTAAHLLSNHFNSELVLEQARLHMSDDGSYSVFDLDIFILAQELAVRKTIRDAKTPLCIVDSSSITTYMYYNMNFFGINSMYSNMLNEEHGVYLVFTPEVEWVDDGTRNMKSISEREHFFNETVRLLKSRNKEYYVISGTDYSKRLLEAQHVISTI